MKAYRPLADDREVQHWNSRGYRFADVAGNLKTRGISIRITDHQVRDTLQITDRSYIFINGQVLVHGTPQEVINHPKARELYFGSAIDADIRRSA